MNKTEEEAKKKDQPTLAISTYLEKNEFTRWIKRMILEGGLENFLLSTFIIYGINYVMGMQRNQKISSQWLDEVRTVIYQNYAVIGTDN